MIAYEEALERIDASAVPHPPAEVGIEESYGRVLAEEIRLPEDLPPFDNSAMDGFAVKGADVEKASPENPVTLRCLGMETAGEVSAEEVAPGTCLQIMTGAIFPESADGVVPVERTSRQGNEITFTASLPPHGNVRRKASEMKAGGLVLSPGSSIGNVEWGLLASANAARVRVFPKPSLALLLTGNELIEPGDPGRPGAIRNSNGFTMRGAARELGIEPDYLGVSADDPKEVKNRFRQGLNCDILVTVGGVSAGERDVIRDLLSDEETGFEEFFYKVRIRPGKPVRCGKIGNTRVFALPGNPVSCLVTWNLFVKPAIRKMSGMKNWETPVHKVRLAEDIHSPAPFLNFWRARLEIDRPDGVALAIPFRKSGSGMLTTLHEADGLIPVPIETETLRAGDVVDYLPLGRRLGA